MFFPGCSVVVPPFFFQSQCNYYLLREAFLTTLHNIISQSFFIPQLSYITSLFSFLYGTFYNLNLFVSYFKNTINYDILLPSKTKAPHGGQHISFLHHCTLTGAWHSARHTAGPCGCVWNQWWILKIAKKGGSSCTNSLLSLPAQAGWKCSRPKGEPWVNASSESSCI